MSPTHDTENDLRGPLIEARAIAHDGPLSWSLNEGPDGHWTNTFIVHGPDGEFLAECEYRPFAELLVAAFDHLGALLDAAEVLRAIADHDWAALLDRTDSVEPPEEFYTVGDFETDARHVYPSRSRLVTEVARSALDRIARTSPE